MKGGIFCIIGDKVSKRALAFALKLDRKELMLLNEIVDPSVVSVFVEEDGLREESSLEIRSGILSVEDSFSLFKLERYVEIGTATKASLMSIGSKQSLQCSDSSLIK